MRIDKVVSTEATSMKGLQKNISEIKMQYENKYHYYIADIKFQSCVSNMGNEYHFALLMFQHD